MPPIIRFGGIKWHKRYELMPGLYKVLGKENANYKFFN